MDLKLRATLHQDLQLQGLWVVEMLVAIDSGLLLTSEQEKKPCKRIPKSDIRGSWGLFIAVGVFPCYVYFGEKNENNITCHLNNDLIFSINFFSKNVSSFVWFHIITVTQDPNEAT